MLTLNSIKLCTGRLTRPGLGVGLRGVNGPFEPNLTSTYKIKQSSFKQAPVFYIQHTQQSRQSGSAGT